MDTLLDEELLSFSVLSNGVAFVVGSVPHFSCSREAGVGCRFVYSNAGTKQSLGGHPAELMLAPSSCVREI